MTIFLKIDKKEHARIEKSFRPWICIVIKNFSLTAPSP
jgi:hypothetical protein